MNGISVVIGDGVRVDNRVSCKGRLAPIVGGAARPCPEDIARLAATAGVDNTV
jgi:hypothetical protein